MGYIGKTPGVHSSGLSKILGWKVVDVNIHVWISVKNRDRASFVFVSHLHRTGPGGWKTVPSHAIIPEILNLFNEYVLSTYYEVGTMQSSDSPGRVIYEIYNNQ